MARVTVIGTGLLGRGIASVAAGAGEAVTLHDSAGVTLAQAHAQLSAVYPGAVQAEISLERAVASADVVIEAIVENLGLKQALFERLGQLAPQAILMSNSSVLPIGQIAARMVAAQRAVGTHWWNPPQLIPVVEVIRGPATSAAVMLQTMEFLRRIGKQPVRVERDVPGFVGNRLQHALWREALTLVSGGQIAAAALDPLIARTVGRDLARCGPLAQIEGFGREHACAELRAVLPTLDSTPAPASRLRTLVAEQHLGAKSGGGFLPWPQGARERAAARLTAHVEQRLAGKGAAGPAEWRSPPLSAAQLQVARRLRAAVWREALALVAGGVCDAATVDTMACNTIGLRLEAMGPVENADYVGLDLTLAIHEAVLPSLEAGIDPSPWFNSASAAPSGK